MNIQNRIIINIPSAQTEAEYIWRTIQDVLFFEKHNYQINLPKGNLIDLLKEKPKFGNLNNEGYEKLENFIRDSLYNKNDYQRGYKK